MELTLTLALAGVWLTAVLFFRLNRVWLLYYLVGSIGLALGIIFIGQSLIPIEPLLEQYVAYAVHLVSSVVGVKTRIFTGAPGLLMVLVIAQDVGWTAVQVTIECSGLLESAVLIGMLAFYPGWPLRQKILLCAVGLAFTQLANVARLMFIIGTLHWFGKDSLFMAHTIVGRAVFFVAVVAIYWYVFTLPTLRTVHDKLIGDMSR